MGRDFYRSGEIIFLDGLYGCGAAPCAETTWGTAGRRLPPLPCGHGADWRLLRRRVDRWW